MTRRILITSAIPYVAGVKHLGNLVGSMLPADIFARFCRSRGYDTLAICATDEHGAPVELAALEEGTPVAEYAAKWHAVQKELGDKFGLAWDNFGRSSSPQNHELTLHFARQLWKNGWLELRTTRQAYSATDGRFLPDRYVIGTCPHCGYDRARGDQCENCTRVLDPVDLINPRSAVSGARDIEIRDSTHLFLKQSQFADKLRIWIDSHKADWPQLVTSIAYKWLDEGLQDRGITRDLEWGIPVPDDIADGKLKGKVFYVWFDAPIEYIASTKEWADKNKKGDAWKDWWFGDKAKSVTYWEFMGKDNVPFHTVGFPVTIMASGEPWKLVDRLKGFNWLNYDGGKFSTSGKRGVFMDAALEVAPADYWRYYLIANAPESSDSNFTWEHFAGVINKDLADVLGNFVNRVTKFCVARFDGQMPGGGDLKRGVHENAPLAGGGEFSAVIIQPVEALEPVDQLPGLARGHDRHREANGMERHIVLAHEFPIGDGLGRIAVPPVFPGIALFVLVGPFLGGSDIFDGRVEPDVEHLALELAIADVVRHRHAPFDVSGDAAILQPLVQPFVRNRRDKLRPVGLVAVDPGAQLAGELRLLQE